MKKRFGTYCLTILAAMFCFGLTACGGDDGATCESVGTALCDMACACTDGDECQFTDGSGSSVSFPSRDDCIGFNVTLGCAADDGSVDFAACDTDLASARCIDAGDGTMGLESPSSCNAE